MPAANRVQKRNCLLAIAALLAIAFFFLAYPLYVIRPFRHQGPSELALALHILRLRPGLEMLCTATAIVALYLYYHLQPKMLRKIGVMFAVALIVLINFLSHINVYEIMFHPMGRPTFVSAADTKLDAGEMVMAVHQGGEARAYPIRIVSYHHIVNDTVGGLPIVATY
jgi:hypothetical protein